MSTHVSITIPNVSFPPPDGAPEPAHHTANRWVLQNHKFIAQTERFEFPHSTPEPEYYAKAKKITTDHDMETDDPDPITQTLISVGRFLNDVQESNLSDIRHIADEYFNIVVHFCAELCEDNHIYFYPSLLLLGSTDLQDGKNHDFLTNVLIFALHNEDCPPTGDMDLAVLKSFVTTLVLAHQNDNVIWESIISFLLMLFHWKIPPVDDMVVTEIRSAKYFIDGLLFLSIKVPELGAESLSLIYKVVEQDHHALVRNFKEYVSAILAQTSDLLIFVWAYKILIKSEAHLNLKGPVRSRFFELLPTAPMFSYEDGSIIAKFVQDNVGGLNDGISKAEADLLIDNITKYCDDNTLPGNFFEDLISIFSTE